MCHSLFDPPIHFPPGTKDKVTSSACSETAVKHRATCYVRDSAHDVLGSVHLPRSRRTSRRSNDRISTHVFVNCQTGRCILASYATCCERCRQVFEHSPQVTTNYSRNVLRNNVGKGNAKISLEERDRGSFQFPFTACRWNEASKFRCVFYLGLMTNMYTNVGLEKFPVQIGFLQRVALRAVKEVRQSVKCFNFFGRSLAERYVGVWEKCSLCIRLLREPCFYGCLSFIERPEPQTPQFRNTPCFARHFQLNSSRHISQRTENRYCSGAAIPFRVRNISRWLISRPQRLNSILGAESFMNSG